MIKDCLPLLRETVFSIYLSGHLNHSFYPMQKKLIFLLAFMVLIAVFALQNSVEVEIKLWFWTVRTSMVLILILTFAAGAIAGILFSIPKRKKEPISQESSTSDLPADKSDKPSNKQVPSENEPSSDEDEFEDVRR